MASSVAPGHAKTLPVRIASFITHTGILFGDMSAMGAVIVLPVVLFALLTRRRSRQQPGCSPPRGKGVGGQGRRGAAPPSMAPLRSAARSAPFDQWAEIGCACWSAAEVLPFCNQLETDSAPGDRFHERHRPIPIHRAPPAARGRPSLTIVGAANVERVLLEGRRATGVLARLPEGAVASMPLDGQANTNLTTIMIGEKMTARLRAT